MEAPEVGGRDTTMGRLIQLMERSGLDLHPVWDGTS